MTRTICVWLMLAAILLSLTGCARSELSRLSDTLGVDLTSGIVEASFDDHGGFHGDGTTFLKIRFSAFPEEIRESKEWCQLPLTDHLKSFVEATSSLFSDNDGNCYLPVVEHGYYCYIDRHYESTDPKDDSELMHRYSFNVTLAVFDSDTNTLYYIKLDT